MKKFLILAAVLAIAVPAAAQLNVALVNGASTTSEPGTTASITTQLQNEHALAGNTTTVFDTPPADLSPFDEVWDIRFSNSSPITAAVEAQYLLYLQAGHAMFVMGENASFMTRNNSVISLVNTLGGGSLTFVVSGSTQTVMAPFTGPNVIPDGNITYLAPGGVTTFGSGQWATEDSSNQGAAVAWPSGTMSNASAGALVVVFDVNFMETTAEADSQTFVRNLIGFIDVEVGGGEPIPTISGWGIAIMIVLLAGLGIFVIGRLRTV